jgi:hypothetical protein
MRAWLSNRSLQSRLVTRPWPALPAMVATDPRIVWPRQGPGAVPGKGKGTSPFTPSPITSGQWTRLRSFRFHAPQCFSNFFHAFADPA